MPAEPRAEVAYFRVADVHIAHFGLGNVLPDDSYEGWDRKYLSIEGGESDERNTSFIMASTPESLTIPPLPAAPSTIDSSKISDSRYGTHVSRLK